jgi:hypothetical protein
MLKELAEIADKMALPSLGYGLVKTPFHVNLDTGEILYNRSEQIVSTEVSRNGTKPLLIADSSEYLLARGPRGPERQVVYLELLMDCYESTKDEDLLKVRDWCLKHTDNIPEVISKCFKGDGKKDSHPDRIIFSVDGMLLTNRPHIKKFWASRCDEAISLSEGVCSVTGLDTRLIQGTVHLKVKGVPNTGGPGAALISFEQSSFSCYGWEGAENAHISFELIDQSYRVMNSLLSNHLTKEITDNKGKQKEIRTYTNKKELPPDITVVYWTSDYGGISNDLWDDPERIYRENLESLFVSPHTGKIKKLPSAEDFYLCFLKGNTGRIAVTRFYKSNVGALRDNIRSFLKYADIPVWMLSSACFRDGKPSDGDKVLKAEIERDLINSLFFGTPIPERFIYMVLHRYCLDDPQLNKPSRIKALKVFLGRKNMNPDDQNTAYYLGRLAFAIHAAKCDKIVKGNKNESYKPKSKVDNRSPITDQLTGLSKSPRQLFRVFMAKYEQVYRLDCWSKAQKIYDEAVENISVDIPKTISTDDQIYFFLGFASARNDYFTSTKNNSNNGENNND